jgi:dTDP-glucose 4,6-dehydratase
MQIKQKRGSMMLSKSDWLELKGQHLFMTGCTRFVGSWLLDILTSANDRYDLGITATVLTRNPEGFKTRCPHLALHPMIRLSEGNVNTFSLPTEYIDGIVHGAIDGTDSMLYLARLMPAKRFMLLSSGEVYAETPESKKKRDIEYLAKKYEQLFSLTIARLFTFVGPYLPLDGRYAVGNFIADALAGRPIHISSSGESIRSYLYGSDMAEWMWKIFIHGYGIYDVGSNRDVMIADVASIVREVVNPKCDYNVDYDSEDISDTYLPRSSRAEKELDCKQTVTLSEGIRRMAEWSRHES